MSGGGYGSLSAGSGGALGAVLERAQDALFALGSCLPCSGLVGGASALKLNGRQYEVVRLLGEGGFSFVYLVRDRTSGREFALKKIRCALGSDTYREALREIEATKRFRSPHIIRLYDSAIVQDGEGKLIYLFLPYYKRGNVQDAINAHTVRGSRFGEKDMLSIFLGTCMAVQALHRYRVTNAQAQRGHMPAPSGGSDATLMPSSRSQSHDAIAPPSHVDEDEDSIAPTRTAPMVIRPKGTDETEGEAVAPLISAADDGPASTYPPSREVQGRESEETVRQEASGSAKAGQEGQVIPYAHRDLKPGNIMLSDDGKPLVYDFGSTLKARRVISSRWAAVAEQDLAAEQSSMPYRAPELFDVKTNTTITESVDIWSLGCVLYAMAYLHSPFETDQTVGQGGSLALAVLNGDYRLPESESDLYSQPTRDVIQRCLTLDPAARPDIEELIQLTRNALRSCA